MNYVVEEQIKSNIALSTGAVEYTECISAER